MKNFNRNTDIAELFALYHKESSIARNTSLYVAIKGDVYYEHKNGVISGACKGVLLRTHKEMERTCARSKDDKHF